jgi:ABC-type sugar transport system ATPase subunit
LAKITLEKLTKNYGDVQAVKGIDLVIHDEEFVVLLGPSGCGKTTTLRCITGLERPSSGKIFFDDMEVNQLEPAKRNVAMVFQFFALYPHLKARQIITFPLRARKLPKKTIRQKLEWVTEMFKLSNLLERYVGGMPPGDKQKIALARAIVRDPNVLLLDEPLSALDEKYREEMRWQLGHIQRELKVTTVYVTHDQREAMSLADRIILMRDGKIVQEAPPEDIYKNPNSIFAGYFIGSPGMNMFDVQLAGSNLLIGNEKRPLAINPELGQRLGQKGAEHFVMGIRPEYLTLSTVKPNGGSSSFAVNIFSTEQIGNYNIFNFRVDEKIFHGMVDRSENIANAGHVSFNMDMVRFFDKSTGRNLF